MHGLTSGAFDPLDELLFSYLFIGKEYVLIAQSF